MNKKRDSPELDAFAEAIRSARKGDCARTLLLHVDRMTHFVRRMGELGRTSASTVLVLAAVDDANGKIVADSLMPGHDWQAYRDRGEVPCARGLAGREGMQEFLDSIDEDAAEKLRTTPGIAVVVVDHGVAEVFSVEGRF